MEIAEPVDDARRQQIEVWIREAKLGCVEARGRLLEACRVYLRDVAGQAMSAPMRVKRAPSDLVQETALDALRDFAQFQGERQEELFAWLRKILLNNATSARRRYEQTAKRRLSLEIPLDAGLGIGRHLRDERAVPPFAAGTNRKTTANRTGTGTVAERSADRHFAAQSRTLHVGRDRGPHGTFGRCRPQALVSGRGATQARAAKP